MLYVYSLRRLILILKTVSYSEGFYFAIDGLLRFPGKSDAFLTEDQLNVFMENIYDLRHFFTTFFEVNTKSLKMGSLRSLVAPGLHICIPFGFGIQNCYLGELMPGLYCMPLFVVIYLVILFKIVFKN